MLAGKDTSHVEDFSGIHDDKMCGESKGPSLRESKQSRSIDSNGSIGNMRDERK